MGNSYFNENTLDDLINEIEYVYLSDNRPWIIGYSGGKDSTVVVHLVYTMLLQLEPQKRHKHVYIVSSDTMVENPLIKVYLSDMITTISNAAKKDGLPLSCKIVQPEPSNTFWANVIGRGFPTPRLNGSFRWCTDRLKIAPSGVFIEDIIKKYNTEVVILLGVRKDESITRKKRIEDREIIGKLLNRHETIKEAYVYPPIVELTTEDIWDVLSSNYKINAWGTNNSRIIELYADADSGECPFAGVSSKSEQTQSCGQSRFGCWICTVVKEDKSLNGFIRSGHKELEPLANFRKWLISIRDIEVNREKKRRDGKVYFTPSGKVGLGPFTWEMRKEILTRLLRLQEQIKYELITIPELKAIDKIWDDELDLTRLALPDLYYDVTGKKLPWHDLKKPLFDISTIVKLNSYAQEFNVPIDLVKNLIFATTKNKHFSNPKILRAALEKSLTQQWLHASVLKELEDED